MQRGLREAKYFVGKRTYGYAVVAVDPDDEESHKTLVIDAIEAAVVREIFSRYNSGQSLAVIRNWLTGAGIASPQDGNWSSQAISRILRNPVVTGRVQYRGQTYMTVARIIDDSVFEKAQERLSSHVVRGPVSKTPAMLTGVVQCEHGHKMYRMKGRPSTTVPDGLYYYCDTSKAAKGQRVLVPLALADEAVSEAVTDVYGDLDHYIRRMTPGQGYADDIASLKIGIRELDPMADDFMTVVAEKRTEIKRLEELASKDAGPKWTLDTKPDGCVRTIGEVWAALDSGGRNKWLRDNGWTITVTKPEGEWLFGIDAGWTAGNGAELKTQLALSAEADIARAEEWLSEAKAKRQ